MATVALTQDNFDQVVNGNDMVVIDFWAPWCGPCKGFAPVFEAASEKHGDIVFAKVNTEEQQELAAAFNIRSIPTLMLFREKVILFSQAGALPGSALEQVITQGKALDMAAVQRKSRNATPERKSKPSRTGPPLALSPCFGRWKTKRQENFPAFFSRIKKLISFRPSLLPSSRSSSLSFPRSSCHLSSFHPSFPSAWRRRGLGRGPRRWKRRRWRPRTGSRASSFDISSAGRYWDDPVTGNRLTAAYPSRNG